MRKEKLMSNENLQKQFVEDAPQQVNELENVRSLSNYVIDLQKLEEEIATAEVKILAETENWHYYDLPQYLADKLWNGRFRGQTQKWFAMEFLGKDSAIKPSSVEKPEFSEWRWVELEVIPSLAVSFKKEIYQSKVYNFKLSNNEIVINIKNDLNTVAKQDWSL